MIQADKLKKCTNRFAQESDILAVWLLGSAQTEQMHSESDVDFAVLYTRGHIRDFDQSSSLISDLEAILGRPVDLGKLNTQNLIYSHEAISKGQSIYNREPVQTSRFVEQVFAMYFDLKQSRKVVEDAYCA